MSFRYSLLFFIFRRKADDEAKVRDAFYRSRRNER